MKRFAFLPLVFFVACTHPQKGDTYENEVTGRVVVVEDIGQGAELLASYRDVEKFLNASGVYLFQVVCRDTLRLNEESIAYSLKNERLGVTYFIVPLKEFKQRFRRR